MNWCPGLGTVLANEEVTADGRSERGNFPVFKRNLKQWMMRITAYGDRLLDDLDTLDWPEPIKLHAAQLDRPVDRRAHRLPDRRRRRCGCSRPGRTPSSAPPTWCWRPSTSWSTRWRRPPGRTGRGTPGPAGTPAPREAVAAYRQGGRGQDRRGAAGGHQGEDRRLHRRVRHQPGHRRADPDLHRRLRAGRLRHRRDHGGARRRTSGTGTFAEVFELPIVRTVQPPEGFDGKAYTGDGPAINSAAPERGLDLNGLGVAEAKARDHRLAGGERARRRRGHLPAARLAVLPAALLGRAVPDRLRRDRRADRAARVDAAGRAARGGRLLAEDVRRRRRRQQPGDPAVAAARLGRGRAGPG